MPHHDDPAIEVQLGDHGHDLLGDLAHGHVVAEDRGADEDHEDHGRGLDGLPDRLDGPGPREPAEGHADHRGQEGAERADLGRRGHAHVEQGHDQDDQSRLDQMRRRLAQRSGPRHDVGLGRVGRADPHPDHDGQDQERRDDEPGDDPGDEQLADGGLGGDAVDDHADAGRDEDVEGGADPDGAGGQLVGVTAPAHLRHGDARHHGGRGQARPRHGPEDAAREDGRDGQAALDAREPVGARGVEIAGEAAGSREVGHQDEHGDRGQHVLGRDAERRRAEDPEDHVRVAAEQEMPTMPAVASEKAIGTPGAARRP